MTRAEVYRAVMQRWPQYRLEDVERLSPRVILWLLESGEENLHFRTMAEYERWLTMTS